MQSKLPERDLGGFANRLSRQSARVQALRDPVAEMRTAEGSVGEIRDGHASDYRAIDDDRESYWGVRLDPLALSLAREEPLVAQGFKGRKELAVLAEETRDLLAVVEHHGAQKWHLLTVARRPPSAVVRRQSLKRRIRRRSTRERERADSRTGPKGPARRTAERNSVYAVCGIR